MAFQENTSRILMLRDWQIQPAARLLEILRAGGNAVDLSSTGVGKCLGKGVLVLMSTGEKRPIENVLPGEALMGPDGSPRRVISISSGHGPLFKISPTRGEPWVCNGEHILVLKSSQSSNLKWHRGAVQEMTVNAWLGLSKTEQVSRWKLFRPDCMNLGTTVISQGVDPYIYGLWIGDGSRGSGALCTMDLELEAEWREYFSEARGFRIREYQQAGNKAKMLHVANLDEVSWALNSWRQFITTSVEGEEKRIRKDYLFSSEKTRLELLAGILDTDGYLCGNDTFELSSCWKQLAEQYIFLCRSLGFYVSMKQKNALHAGRIFPQWRLFISGNVNRIPCRLPRKKPGVRSINKTIGTVGFKITPIGEGDFFGVVLDKDRRFLLHDFTVTHNTAHAAHVIAELKLPTLVVAPKIARTSWLRMLEHFGTSATVTNWEAVTVGKTPFGTWDKPATAETRGKVFFICQNCLCKFSADESPRRCSSHSAGIHCFVRKPAKHKRGRFSWAPQIRFLVLDELHRAGSIKSLNAEIVIAARRQQIKMLGLSATLATSPLGMRAVGFMLDLFSNPDAAFYSWTRRHGCGRIPNLPGWHWKVGAERRADIMRNISSEILPAKGARLTTYSIPNFPKRIITAELYDLEKDYEINKIYSEMASALDALSLRASQDVSGESPLTQIIRARQRIELLKIPLFVELAEDALAAGNSVAIFVNFTATLDALRERLRCDCFVSGSPEGVSERDNNIARFQRNENRLILLNSAAGGVAINLQDLHGVPRVCLYSPSFSATEFRQVCGRTHRDGGRSPAIIRVILAANTIEEKIKKALDNKLANLDSLLDSDLTPNE